MMQQKAVNQLVWCLFLGVIDRDTFRVMVEPFAPFVLRQAKDDFLAIPEETKRTAIHLACLLPDPR